MTLVSFYTLWKTENQKFKGKCGMKWIKCLCELIFLKQSLILCSVEWCYGELDSFLWRNQELRWKNKWTKITILFCKKLFSNTVTYFITYISNWKYFTPVKFLTEYVIFPYLILMTNLSSTTLLKVILFFTPLAFSLVNNVVVYKVLL